MRRQRRYVIATLCTALAALICAPAAFAQKDVSKQIQQVMRRAIQQQRQAQQRLLQAQRQRNQKMVEQYRKAIQEQQKAYREQMKEYQEAGITPQQLLEMQRQQILASVPRSQRGALQRKWARQDRLRARALERARRTGDAPPQTGGGLGDLGGGDLNLDDEK